MNTVRVGYMSEIAHDCHVCVSLLEEFGTCEYMHEANPTKCTCWMTSRRQKTNVQSTLGIGGTDRERLRYWRQWSLTEGIRLGLTVHTENPAPLSSAEQMSAKQTSLLEAPVAVQPGEIKSPAGPHNDE